MARVDDYEAAQLAEVLRPSLEELSKHFFQGGVHGILGLCFDLGEKPLFFAESHDWEDPRGVASVPYFLARTDAFTTAVLTDLGVSTFVVRDSSEEKSVVEPVRAIFGEGTEHVRVMSLTIGKQADRQHLPDAAKAVIYLVTAPWTPGALLRFAALQDLSFLFVHVIRYALFLLRASDQRMLRASNELSSLLSDGLPDLESRGQTVVKYAQLGLKPPPGHYGSRAYSQRPAPEVTADPGLVPTLLEEEMEMLRSLRSHRSVKVLRRLSGSFQQLPVLMVELTPHEEGSRSARGVVKKAQKKSVEREIKGYHKILNYYSDIDDVLPPAPQHFLLEDNDEWQVVWTPAVAGNTLYEVARESWDDRAAETSVWFKEVFLKLCRFLEAIGTETYPEITPYQLLVESHFGDGEEALRRREKTLGALGTFVGCPADEPRFRPEWASLDLVNPLWVLSNHEKIDGPWKSVPGRRSLTYFHGDFHAGNILVSAPSENAALNIYILDFDYVGVGPRWEDRACLEASFLLALAASTQFSENPDLLRDSFIPTLELLAGVASTDIGFAHRVEEVVRVLRPQGDSELIHYRAALVKALLRLAASHSRKAPEQAQDSAVGIACSHYLGALLTRLVGE